MGTPSSNCFRSKDQYATATANKNSKGSSHTLPTANVKIWKQSLGMIEKKQIIDFQYPKYIVHPTFRNVEKDITRTFPDCSFFGGKKLHLDTFAQVLQKLAVYFPHIGYTQGMNFIVGFFLLSGLNAEQTFTISVKVLTNYDLMCLGLYEQCFPLTRFYCSLVWQILEVANPSIKKKINQFSILDDLWIFQWFTTLFIYSFPFETIPQIWTFLFVNKQFASVRIVSAIVLLLWPFIQKCEFDIDFMNLISELKNQKSFNKKLKIKDILQKASEIKNQDILKLVPQVQQYSKNKYAVFFSLAENDRKIKYLQFLSELSVQRQQFLKNSKGYKFDRKQSDIEVIDSIEINQAKMLHQSFTYRIKSNPPSHQILNEKLWKSDVYKLMTEASKKTIEQPKTSNSNENLSVMNKNDDVLDNQAPGLILNPSLLLNEHAYGRKQHEKKC